MDHKRTRLRSQPAAAVSKEVHHASFLRNQETVLQRGDLVEVEVEGEHNRGLPVVRGVNKRKRDPRGAGRRLPQKVDSKEGSVSVFVDSQNAKAGSSEINKTSGEKYESKHRDIFSIAATPTTALNTYVIIPEIMPQDQAVMKQLDKRRESSRLRVKPSKFREGFLSSSTKARVGGDQRGADDVTSSVEVVIPMDAQNTSGASTRVDYAKASTLRASESESSLDRPSIPSSERNKFKFTYKSGVPRSTDLVGPVADSSFSFKKGFDDRGLKAALAVVKRVMQIKSAEPFNEPVDPVALEIPDYFDVIKEPMDLGTIRELLEGGKKYMTAQDVYDDVQLVWSNCRKYNQEGDPIMDILKIVENSFNKHWSAAGLQGFGSGRQVPKLKKQRENNESNSRGLLSAAPEHHEGEDTKRRKSKGSKIIAKLHAPKIMQFDTSNLRAKAKRSASVEQVMAESKAREYRLDTEDKECFNEDSHSTERGSDYDLVEAGQSPQRTVDKEFQERREAEEAVCGGCGGQGVEQEVNSLKEIEAREADVQIITEQAAKTPGQDKENALWGSLSNKRRTFGIMHHKPECPCVVCVGRRRKLARQEREGIEGKDTKRDKGKSSNLFQGSSQATKVRIAKVTKPPKPPQPQESVPASTNSLVTEIAVEPVQTICQLDNALGVDAMVDGVRYYPTNYELPLRKVNPSLFQLSKILFTNHQNTVWKRHNSLGYHPPTISKGSMFEAVHALTLNP